MVRALVAAFAAVWLVFAGTGCAESPDAVEASTTSAVGPEPPQRATTTDRSRVPEPPLDPCAGLGLALRVPVRTDPPLLEISGAVLSRRTPGAVWVHEDSGNAAQLIELTFDGREVSRLDVAGAQNVDWEDLAAAHDHDGRRHLFVGDVGDNRRTRPHVEVLRVPEPLDPGAGSTEPAEVLTLVHADGAADVEALIVDPTNGDLVLLTKELSGLSHVLVAPGAAWRDDGATIALEERGSLRLGPGQAVLAADLSPSGDLVAVRTPFRVLLWSHSAGQAVVETLLGGEPCRAPSVFDPFGEAIALLDEGYVLVGEGEDAELVVVR